MLRFEDPIFLWLLWIIPVLILIRLIGWRRRKAKLKKLGDPELLKQLMPNISKYRPTVKFVLMLAALALLIVMVARPQMGSKISHDKRHGIETIICLDISNSMLCQDVVPSRLDKSKMLIENLVDNFNNDKIGLIVFAGDAFVQLPITTDYVSAKMFLQNITPGLIRPREPISEQPSIWLPRVSPSRRMWAEPSSLLPMAKTMSLAHRKQRLLPTRKESMSLSWA